MSRELSLRVHARDALCRARKLPIGSMRNEMRKLAKVLLKLHKSGLRAHVEIIGPVSKH
jgi:hypothetical protein